LVDRGFEELVASEGGDSELRFHSVAQGHEFFDFCDDALLFGEGWERYSDRA